MNSKQLIITFLAILSFQINSAQQKNIFKKTIKIHGRIQYDFEFLKREQQDDWLKGNEFRRVYFSAGGNISKKISYKLEVNIAQGQIGFNDMYIKYNTGDYGVFGIGSIAEPTGLEIQTSSKYIPFFERAMITSLQNYRWGSGFHYENKKLMNELATIQLAITNNGLTTEGFKDKYLEKGLNYVGRITGTPYFDKNNNILVHLGINFASRPGKELKFRPENHMGDKYHYEFPRAKRRYETGIEFATNYHSASIQAEYKQSKQKSKNKNYLFKGYNIMGSYFLTGEYRPYKHGSFGRVKPLKDISNHGFGAVELLVRYSNMTPSQDIIDINPSQPEVINNLSFGLNWYLNPQTRIMYNYVITNDKNNFVGNLNAHLIRLQIDF